MIILAAASSAAGQLGSTREFCGVNRPIPITVAVPAAAAAIAPAPPPDPPQPKDETQNAAEASNPPPEGSSSEPAKPLVTPAVAVRIEIEMIRAANGEVIDRSTAEAGPADLAKLFPRIWATEDKRPMLAQLRVDGRRVGAPLLLSPMFSPPPYAQRLDRAGFPMFPAPDANRAPPAFSGYRVRAMRLLVLETSKGELKFALRPDLAPNTVGYVSWLVEGGMYTDTEFHKVASLTAGSSPDFVQTGDPTGTGLGGAGFLFDLEDSTLRHEFGVISMARAGDPNSASSQFFISLGGAAAATLDGKYAAFGQLIAGADVLRAIAASPVGPDNRPLQPPRILTARLIDAPPLGDGPPPARDPLAEKPAR